MTPIFPAAVLIASTFTILFFAHVADRRAERRSLSNPRPRDTESRFAPMRFSPVTAATMRGLHEH